MKKGDEFYMLGRVERGQFYPFHGLIDRRPIVGTAEEVDKAATSLFAHAWAFGDLVIAKVTVEKVRKLHPEGVELFQANLAKIEADKRAAKNELVNGRSPEIE